MARLNSSPPGFFIIHTLHNDMAAGGDCWICGERDIIIQPFPGLQAYEGDQEIPRQVDQWKLNA